MIESEPRKWIWTYQALPKPLHGPRMTTVGSWRHDDDRELRDHIGIEVTAEGRAYPHLPYWDGTSYGPWSQCIDTPCETLEDAIALCESYLARDPLDW